MSTPAVYKPFSDFSLQKAIDRAVSNLPADKTVAVVAHVDSEEGASLSMVLKVGDEWKLSGTLVKRYDEPFKWGAEVVWCR